MHSDDISVVAKSLHSQGKDMDATEKTAAATRMSDLAQRLVELVMSLQTVRVRRLGLRNDVDNKVPAPAALPSGDKLA